MARKRPGKKSKNNDHFPKMDLTKFLIITGIVLIIIFLLKLFAFETQSVKESPKSEIVTVPQDIRRNFQNGSGAAYQIPILMYHFVENVKDQRDTARISMNIKPEIFEAQIKTLHDAGYTFLTARELGSILSGIRPIPPKPVLITFDDGHWDNATVVLPILKKYNASATFYIIPDFLNESDFLSDAQMKEIIDSGIVEIGAHTLHHVSLTGKLTPLVNYEVVQSKKTLEQKFGIRVFSFAYPNGAFDNQAITAVKNAGYTSAVSTIPGTAQSTQNQFYLFRLRPAFRTGEELLKFFKQKEFKPYNG
jgi:peptidoglycan/xylan/chitin deacetylase (PgdA/CDA1 family)